MTMKVLFDKYMLIIFFVLCAIVSLLLFLKTMTLIWCKKPYQELSNNSVNHVAINLETGLKYVPGESSPLTYQNVYSSK